MIKTTRLIAFLTLFVTGYCAAAPMSTLPVPRTKQFQWMSLSTWYQKHAEDVKAAERGDARLVFWGDSITDNWSKAQSLWDREFGPYGAVNFGIGGDLTQNMLWRLDHGTLEQLDPDVVVVLAGVNNFLHNNASPEDTFAGVQAVVGRILSGYPHAQVVLQGIFPYGEQPGTAERQRVKTTNTLIATLADKPRVDYYDFGDIFLDDDGRIRTAIMADHLHPTVRGYERWAKALRPILHKLLDE